MPCVSLVAVQAAGGLLATVLLSGRRQQQAGQGCHWYSSNYKSSKQLLSAVSMHAYQEEAVALHVHTQLTLLLWLAGVGQTAVQQGSTNC